MYVVADERDVLPLRTKYRDVDVLLIDDVMTTGATLNELARTLKRAGAETVKARVIARTIVSQNQ